MLGGVGWSISVMLRAHGHRKSDDKTGQPADSWKLNIWKRRPLSITASMFWNCHFGPNVAQRKKTKLDIGWRMSRRRGQSDPRI